MGSRKLLPVNPLWLLVAGVVGFGGWVAYDAARPSLAPRAAVAGPEEPHEPELVVIAPNQPPIHPGMPRRFAEQVLASAEPAGPEATDTLDGVSVRRVSYRVELPPQAPRPDALFAGWALVTVHFDATHPMQPVVRVSAVPTVAPERSHSAPELLD